MKALQGYFVIASEAKQPRSGAVLDCFVAALLAMTSYSLIAPRSGRWHSQIATPASAATAAIIMKNAALSMPLQKLPSQPARKLPTKLAASHTPIIIDSMRAGASLVTSDRPIGDR